MVKSLFYRWFGLRKIPDEIRNRLSREGILFDEEGTSCALAYRNFKGERKYSTRGWQTAVAGSLLITNKTFFVALPYAIQCEKPIDEALAYLGLELKENDRLVMKFDVENLFANSSGELSCHWRMNNADAIFRHLQSLQQEQVR